MSKTIILLLTLAALNFKHSESFRASNTKNYHNYYCFLSLANISDCAKTIHFLCEYAPCSPSKSCGNSALIPNSDTYRKNVLDAINVHRNNVARGNWKLWSIKGSNMNALSYSLEMEIMAQCATSICERFGDVFNCTYSYKYEEPVSHSMWGTWIAKPAKFNKKPYVRLMVNDWIADESNAKESDVWNIPNYSVNLVRVWTWANLIWARTKYVGCGQRVVHGNTTHVFYVVYCFFTPGVESGRPAFDRSNRNQCDKYSSQYTYLCEEVIDPSLFNIESTLDPGLPFEMGINAGWPRSLHYILNRTDH